jgi:hypothetical protein
MNKHTLIVIHPAASIYLPRFAGTIERMKISFNLCVFARFIRAVVSVANQLVAEALGHRERIVGLNLLSTKGY